MDDSSDATRPEVISPQLENDSFRLVALGMHLLNALNSIDDSAVI